MGLIILEPDLGTGVAIYGTLWFDAVRRRHADWVSCLDDRRGGPGGLSLRRDPSRTRGRTLDGLSRTPRRTNTTSGIRSGNRSAFGLGLTGLGLGAGQQSCISPRVAHPISSSVIGQELGFVGVVLAIVAYAILAGRGLWLSSKMTCRFPMFLALGRRRDRYSGVHNMAVALALLPTKGMTPLCVVRPVVDRCRVGGVGISATHARRGR